MNVSDWYGFTSLILNILLTHNKCKEKKKILHISEEADFYWI